MLDDINYQIKRSAKAKRLSIGINLQQLVTVTIPLRFKESLIPEFIELHRDWIEKHLEKISKREKINIDRSAPNATAKHFLAAKKKIIERVKHFNTYYQFDFKKITIRNQTSRWGSCSRQGNLNFNYKLIFLDENLLDYVVIHELCHLKEMNHGTNFWLLVREQSPDYLKIRKKLKNIIIQ